MNPPLGSAPSIIHGPRSESHSVGVDSKRATDGFDGVADILSYSVQVPVIGFILNRNSRIRLGRVTVNNSEFFGERPESSRDGSRKGIA